MKDRAVSLSQIQICPYRGLSALPVDEIFAVALGKTAAATAQYTDCATPVS
jgi:hypothetical protein